MAPERIFSSGNEFEGPEPEMDVGCSLVATKHSLDRFKQFLAGMGSTVHFYRVSPLLGRGVCRRISEDLQYLPR